MGAIYTERNGPDGTNRVGGLDGRFSFGPHTPSQGPAADWNLTVTLQPIRPLRIDNTWLSSSLATPNDQSVFRNRIVRSKVDWQVTRELAVRTIVQHNSIVADPRYTVVPNGSRVNADFLLSYVVNPWTAFYAGYNGNVRTFDQNDDRLFRDAQQFSMKMSYLYRF